MRLEHEFLRHSVSNATFLNFFRHAAQNHVFLAHEKTLFQRKAPGQMFHSTPVGEYEVAGYAFCR